MTCKPHLRYLYSNRFTGTLPTELGNMVKMTADFAVDLNSFSSSIPTQLGRLVKLGIKDDDPTIPMYTGFWLRSNFFCSDVPTEVQALSSQVAYWGVTTGNSIGTVSGAHPDAWHHHAITNIYRPSYSPPHRHPTTNHQKVNNLKLI